MKTLSRRMFSALPLLGAIPAKASEWLQSYDTGSRVDAIRYNETPLISQTVIAATEKAVADMQAIAARGGWPIMPRSILRSARKGSRCGCCASASLQKANCHRMILAPASMIPSLKTPCAAFRRGMG